MILVYRVGGRWLGLSAGEGRRACRGGENREEEGHEGGGGKKLEFIREMQLMSGSLFCWCIVWCFALLLCVLVRGLCRVMVI